MAGKPARIKDTEKAAEIKKDVMLIALLNYYDRIGFKVCLTRPKRQDQGQLLDPFVQIYKSALLDGRKVTSTSQSRRGAGSSLVQIRFNDEIYAGEIRVIFQHKQAGVPESEQRLLAFIIWMIPSTQTPLDDDDFMWNEFPELGVETWLYKQYALSNGPNHPPQVIPLADIQGQVGRGKIDYTDPPLWITTTMDRVRSAEIHF
ncbi:hypothetical protein C8R45DRAFT_1175608 [Mycena sanguinolenta]|nr:hypothetical protein C8R45DRAFT_1175608 [Mycena sanguinolenta]